MASAPYHLRMVKRMNGPFAVHLVWVCGTCRRHIPRAECIEDKETGLFKCRDCARADAT